MVDTSAAARPWPTISTEQVGWRVFGLTGTLAILTFLAVPSVTARASVSLLVGASAAGALVLGVRLHRPALTRPWRLMAVGLSLWVLGDVSGRVTGDLLGWTAAPSFADVASLAAYPFLAWGLHLLVIGRRRRMELGAVLDAATVTAGLGLLSWVVLAGPTLKSSAEAPLATAVAVAYPVADILLVGGLVMLCTSPGSNGRAGRGLVWILPVFGSLRLLLVAVGLLILADTGAAASGLYGGGPGREVEVLRLTSYVAWGTAALHPSMTWLSRPDTQSIAPFRRLRLVGLVLATLVAPLILAVQTSLGLSADVWPVVIGSVVMFVLVVARMSVAIDQIGAVNAAREQLQAELEHQALHDPLTGLPNRTHVLQLLGTSLESAARSGTATAVLFIDLDGFKGVNDAHGHRAGDVVLRAVAQRMLGEVRESDAPCRLGGDEFVVVLQEVGDEATALNVAERLVTALTRPIELDEDLEVTVGASIGVAIGSAADTDAESLLHDADVAVYRAKARGKGRVELFDSSLRREFTHPSELEGALVAALAADELVVRYQPVVDVASGGLLGVEALVRWDRPGIGLVPPSAFIPVAESSSLICELDAWMLMAAGRQLATWNAARGDRRLTMAVNISGRHISVPRIVTDVEAVLSATGIAPPQLVLEITETYLVDDRTALVHLSRLRELGVTISLDDFGMGYNSFARLSALPVDVVKIDRKFVDTSTPASRTLLELMVHAAHQFGLPVVGEGVERSDQLELLRSVGCEMAQGFLLGRPMAAEELRVVA